MRILTVTGTRPELIRLSVILGKLDRLCEHIHVFTNQNFEESLSTVFFKDLGIRDPDYYFDKTSGIGEFLGHGFQEFERILYQESPDKVLVLGDTNSGLMSILAAKQGFPVYHMEAGNRCYDDSVPEELNRRVIDACSTVNLPYTENSKQNLINEGFHKNRVFKTGNPIKEVLQVYEKDIDGNNILYRMKIKAGAYGLLTLHRAENVDDKMRAYEIVSAINQVAAYLPILFPAHPRTANKLKQHGLGFTKDVTVLPSLGFFEFAKLEKHARVVLTDSGTVPEETSLLGIPCVILRKSTERQELLENGGVILAGIRKQDIVESFGAVLEMKQGWSVLEDYAKTNVSETVIRLLLGQREK